MEESIESGDLFCDGGKSASHVPQHETFAPNELQEVERVRASV
jgi:hypothetical protein